MLERTFTKFLSGSTNGRQIKVTSTSTPGTTIHTTPSTAGGLDVFDKVFIYATNTSSVTRDVTIEFGGTTNPDDLIPWEILDNVGPILIVPGLLLNNGLIIKAFGSSSINISGYVYRIPINSQGLTKLQ